MPLEISKVLGFGLSKITSVLYIFIFCTGWSSTKLTLTNHSVALSLRSCQLLREISLGYFLSVRCCALPLLTGAGMSVGSFYYGVCWVGSSLGRTIIYLTLSLLAHTRWAYPPALFTLRVSVCVAFSWGEGKVREAWTVVYDSSIVWKSMSRPL